jgi:hypothetical protein
MSSTLELDQDDMTARLMADATCGQVTVFSQRKGITENDVKTRLAALNQTGGVVGLVLIVLMPKLLAQEANTPGAMYATRYSVQVIDWPAVRRQTTLGIQITAETMAERVRQILHFASFGRGQALFFDGMEPLPMADPNQISYAINFRKMGADTAVSKVATPTITPNGGAVAEITLACSTSGAAIYYSVDGSYPSAIAAAASPATSTIYSVPFTPGAACTLRVAASKSGLQQSDPNQALFT